FGDLFLFRRVWHHAIPTPPPMVCDSVGIARCYTLLRFVFACKVKTQLMRAALGFAACQSKKAQHHIAQGSALGIECIY
ncbi:hypothetical protein HMPREF0673_02522, partial [Leyella stercorea DSM 18206]